MLLLAQTAASDDARHKDLLRLLRGAGRWLEMASVVERELSNVPAEALGRQVDVLLELGELRAERLDRPADAAQAYEAVLERDPKNPLAAERLETLYEQLGGDRDLARLLEQRAE